MTIEPGLRVRSDLARLASAWSAALEPDGRRVAYVTDRDGAPRVWLRELDTERERVLETGSHHVAAVSWSVCGQWLALLAAPGGSPRSQVWVVRPDGSGLQRVGAIEGGATFLGPWTHRPGVLALATSATPAAESCAFLLDVGTGQRTEICGGQQAQVLDVDRGLTRALVRRGPRGARSVWLVDLRSGADRQLLPPMAAAEGGVGSTDLGRLTPDGRFAYVRSNAGGEMYGLFEVALDRLAAPGSTRLIAERAEAELENIMLDAGGTRAHLLWNFAGRSEAQRLDLATRRVEDVPLPQPVSHDASFSRDGRYLACTLEGPTEPRALWLYDLDGSRWRRLHAAPALSDVHWTHPTLETLRAHDGLQITGWLYRGKGEPRALLLHLHGGPEAQERPAWNPLFQALAAAGISVFAPNIRGSSGFGRSFTTADDRERRWDAFRDVQACAQYVLDRGLATQDRLACGGRSYGGYLTLAMLAFYPQLFAAGVDVCGMSDLQTFYRNTEPFIAQAAYPKYGHPVHDAELLRALSPIHRVDKLRVPLLVVHGANDSNVPLSESEQVVRRARELGANVEYLLYEGEGHELALAHHREHFIGATVSWLHRVLRL